MKCPNCFALNCDSDEFCIGCHTSLAKAREAQATAKLNAATPQWAYFFVAVCGAIPVVTIGGAIPAVVGVGGACSCFCVARAFGVPAWLRFVVCLGITIVAWLLLITLIVELLPSAKKRWMDLIG